MPAMVELTSLRIKYLSKTTVILTQGQKVAANSWIYPKDKKYLRMVLQWGNSVDLIKVWETTTTQVLLTV